MSKKRPRHDSEIELDKRVSDHMKATGRYVVSDARRHVLEMDPCLARRIDELPKGKTPR
jgi:hypothetical protein